jgi:hypothetical protein
MLYTISAVKKTTLTTKAGGTWVKTEVRLKETGDTTYELNFSKYIKDNLVAGQQHQGYLGERSWTGKNGTIITKTFNSISAEYVYALLLKLNPNIEAGYTEAKTDTLAPKSTEPKADEWSTTGPEEEEANPSW